MTLDRATIERIEEFGRGPGPILVATDLDGTLAPIVERPWEAVIPDATLQVLGRLAAKCRVAIITGRDLNTARSMAPVENVIVIGSHGLEASIESELLPVFDRTELAASLERVEQQVITAVPAVFQHIERKAISTAFHFRDAPELEGDVARELRELPEHLMLRQGKMVLEVLPRARGGKDRALLALADRFRPRSVLAVGDDETDVAMFGAALKLREEGRAVLVAGVTGGTETPPGITEQADIVLDSTEETCEALTALANVLDV